jgi:HAD superfamily hydrolase (TIGR01509 family)
LLLDHGGPSRQARALGQSYLAYLSGRGDTLPGAKGALLRLRRRFGVAAVTNGYDRVQRSRLEAARLTPHFDAIVTSEGCGFTKPHPGIVHAALEALRVRPEQAVYVGDDLATDGAAARAAGVPFYWLDRGDPPAPGHAVPRRRVLSLAELADRLRC